MARLMSRHFFSNPGTSDLGRLRLKQPQGMGASSSTILDALMPRDVTWQHEDLRSKRRSMNKHSHIIHSKQNNMYCCWNCFFQPILVVLPTPETVINPKKRSCFFPPSWTLSCSRNSKRASLLISSWSNHWVTSGNRKLKNLGPEAMGWIADGSLMVVDGRFCRIFSMGEAGKSDLWMTSS